MNIEDKELMPFKTSKAELPAIEKMYQYGHEFDLILKLYARADKYRQLIEKEPKAYIRKLNKGTLTRLMAAIEKKSKMLIELDESIFRHHEHQKTELKKMIGNHKAMLSMLLKETA